jgi:hypothetical protein
MNVFDERLLQERFQKLEGPNDGDWGEVRGRVRTGRWRTLALATALTVALVAAGLAVGGRVVGLFDVHGKRIPLGSLSARDRELLTTLVCRRIELRTAPGKAPEKVCLDGEPTIEEIANDGVLVHWRIKYPGGMTCLASHPIDGYHDPNRGDSMIGSLECNRASSKTKLVPTPDRPITVDAAVGASVAHPDFRLLWVTGLAGEGVARVELEAADSTRLPIKVRGHAYSLKRIPDRPWRSIVALDESGKEVYRESLPVGARPRSVRPEKAPPPRPSPKPPARPQRSPVQHAGTPVAAVDVYRNGVVALTFASPSGEVYRRLARTNRGTVGIACARVAYGAGRWKDLGGFGNAPLAREVIGRLGGESVRGGHASRPFDYCEVGGTYGRYWNSADGPHELVEVPFTALGRRYLDERAAARDLAYFVRTKQLHRIRLAIHRSEQGPSANELARIFGPRVVPLASRAGTVPKGKIGVWTDGKIIVASELTPGGRRLYVTVRGVLIGANNIRDLAFPF